MSDLLPNVLRFPQMGQDAIKLPPLALRNPLPRDAHISASPTFDDLADDYIAAVEKEVKLGLRPPSAAQKFLPIVRAYIAPFFADRPLSSVVEGDIDAYRVWRRLYWSRRPQAKQEVRYTRRVGNKTITIRRPVARTEPNAAGLDDELIVLLEMLDFAAGRGSFQMTRPLLQAFRETKRRRPRAGFDEAEFLRLIEASEVIAFWLKSQDGSETAFYNSMKLHSFLVLSAFGGFRAGDLSGLRWADVGPVPTVFQGKASLQGLLVTLRDEDRTVVLDTGLTLYFRMLREVSRAERGRDPDGHEPIFSDARGHRVVALDGDFETLLKNAGLGVTREGHIRDFSSLATFHTMLQLKPDMQEHLLKRLNQVSVRLIEKIRAD